MSFFERILEVEGVLFIAFIFFLGIVILSGRMLDDINKSDCYKHSADDKIKKAHLWIRNIVITSSVLTAVCLILFIVIIVF